MNNQLSELSKVLTKAVNEIFQEESSKCKGTATYYILGEVDNIKVCYTKAKTYYHNKFGFYSWLQRTFKNGMTKRTKFAYSGSRKSCEKRANKLLNNLTEKNAI